MQPRDLKVEAVFLSSIFQNFDSSVIDEVLKQFPSLDEAFIHLQEFLDLNYDEDSQEEEEQKGGAQGHSAAASSVPMQDSEEFDA